MEALPLLPKTKSAWIACLFSIVILFVYYYTFLYPELLESYKQQNLVIPYAIKQNNSLTKDLEVNLIIPKSLGTDAVQYAAVSIHNLKEETIYLRIKLIWEKTSENTEEFQRSLSAIGLIDRIEPEEVSIQVQPNSFGFIRLPLIFIGESINLKEDLYVYVAVLTSDGELVNQEKLSADKESIPTVNRINSSLYYVLKNLLLPPFANGFLAGLAIMSCWFYEKSVQTEDKIILGDVMKVLIKSTFLSFVLITVFYFFETKKLVYALLLLLITIWVYILTNHRSQLVSLKNIKGWFNRSNRDKGDKV